MTTIVKEDELVRRAFAFIEERLESMKQEGRGGKAAMSDLLDEAGARFNLSPGAQRTSGVSACADRRRKIVFPRIRKRVCLSGTRAESSFRKAACRTFSSFFGMFHGLPENDVPGKAQ